MRSKLIPLLLALAFACGLAAQTPQAGAGGVPETSLASSAPAFRLSAGDTIEIKCFYNPELSDTFQIRPDGRVSLALIGEVELQGKSVPDAVQELTERYSKVLKTPGINLVVRSFGSQRVYVGGEVVRPTTVSLMGRMSVLDAVMEAGGAKHTGANSIVLIRRSANNTPELHRVSLRGSGKNEWEAARTAVQPLDVILVPETKVARLDRWVDQNLRQMVPGYLTAGFNYLLNPQLVQ
jgi:polysaccharide export outer membrane protein